MSPLSSTRKKAHSPRVGSLRDPPYLWGEGAKYVYVHIHIHTWGQRATPHQSAQSSTQALCLEDGDGVMKGEDWIQVFPEGSFFEGREKPRGTQQGSRDLSALLVRLDYSRSLLWIVCCPLVMALPLPFLAEVTVTAEAISPLGDALEKPPTTSLQRAEKSGQGEKQPPLPGSLPRSPPGPSSSHVLHPRAHFCEAQP